MTNGVRKSNIVFVKICFGGLFMAELSKKTKKRIKLIVWLVLLAAFLAVGLYFTLRKTSDYQYTEADGGITIDKYVGGETSVVIPEEIDGKPVTGIGRFCFSGQKELTDVTLPESIERISIYAFEDCASLTQIELPAGLKEIAAGAFRNSGLTSIVLPEGVTAVREQAFYGCAALESAALPESLTIIEDGAFAGCSSLAAIEFPDVMAEIGAGAFEGCASLKSVVFPMFTTAPDNEDDQRISVSPRTFKNCTGLKTVELTGVTHWIDEEAFMGCTSLESVSAEGGCWVGKRAFSGCSALKSFDFGGNVNGWVMEYAFENCSSLETVENTGKLKFILDGAFAGCSALKKIELSMLTEQLGEGVFEGCTSLTVYALEGSLAANYAKANGIPVREPGA